MKKNLGVIMGLYNYFADDLPLVKPDPKGSAKYRPNRSKRAKNKRRKKK
jgi:hypothetical protein